MDKLIKNWRIRMVNYRQEADHGKNKIIRLKAMNRFLALRDCLKELENELSNTNKPFNNCIGVHVDKSNAIVTHTIRDTVFKKGSKLNK